MTEQDCDAFVAEPGDIPQSERRKRGKSK